MNSTRQFAEHGDSFKWRWSARSTRPPLTLCNRPRRRPLQQGGGAFQQPRQILVFTARSWSSLSSFANCSRNDRGAVETGVGAIDDRAGSTDGRDDSTTGDDCNGATDDVKSADWTCTV